MIQALCTTVAVFVAGSALAAPVTYKVDPDHTYPSFEADHLAGLSVWRGKMNKSSGTVTYDKADGGGGVDIAIDLNSIDFGQNQLNAWARGSEFFDTRKFPKARYTGRFDGGANGVPAQVLGELTLHGVTRPVALKIHTLKCIPHPVFKRELCGADASGSFRRDEFGLDAGKDWGFDMTVTLRIQIEVLAQP